MLSEVRLMAKAGINILVVLTSLAYSASAYALILVVITYSPGSLTFSPSGPYSVPRNQAIGSLLGTARSSVLASNFNGACTFQQTVQVSGTELSAGSGVYTTGVSGIGVSFYVTPNSGTRTKITGLQSVAFPAFVMSGPGEISLVESELIVTGAVAPGTLSSLPSINVTNNISLGLICLSLGSSNRLLTAVSNPAVTAITCSVTTPAITVTLPTISRTQLGAVGQTAGNTGFNIGLNCSSGSNVFITLTDATTPGNRTSLLTLKPASTATGIKLRILKSDGSLVLYGPDSAQAGNTNQWLVGPSGSTNTIPLRAQYYRDGATVGEGTVEAAATFTLSYQ